MTTTIQHGIIIVHFALYVYKKSVSFFSNLEEYHKLH